MSANHDFFRVHYLFFQKKCPNIWLYKKKAVPLRSLLVRKQFWTVIVYDAHDAGKDG